MKARTWFAGYGVLVVAGLAAILFSGCTTPLVQRPYVDFNNDAEAYYLIKAALDAMDADARNCATVLVDKELEKRCASRPGSSTKRILDWQTYTRMLRQPVNVSADAYKSVPFLTKSDQDAIGSAIRAKPELLKLEGTKYSGAWKKELDSADDMIKSLQAEYEQAVQTADSKQKAGRFAESLSDYKRALTIRPDQTALEQAMGQSYSRYRETEVDRLRKQVLNSFAEIEKNKAAHFGQDSSTFDIVKQCEQALTMINPQFNTVRSNLIKYRPSERYANQLRTAEVVLRDLENQLDMLKSECFAERINLHRKAQQYWNAYLYIREELLRTSKQPDHRRQALASVMVNAFLSMLPEGMDYYIKHADHNYSNDRFGLTIVFCLMAHEMYEYVHSLGLTLSPKVQGIHGMIETPWKDSEYKLGKRFERRLIVLDFVPAVTEEGLTFADQLRSRCYKTYEKLNDSAWALLVPQTKSFIASIDSIQKDLKPEDYLISGAVSEISIEKGSEDIERKMISIPGANIREMPNPLYKVKEGEPQLIWEQEVYNYEQTKRLKDKTAVIKLSVESQNAGSKQTLVEINQTINHKNNPFQDTLTLKNIETEFTPALRGTPMRSWNKDKLIPGELPRNVKADLSSDKEITTVLLKAALDTIMVQVDRLVQHYPVDALAKNAIKEARERNVREAAELWAECFFYCYKLTIHSMNNFELVIHAVDIDKEKGWLEVKRVLRGNTEDWTRKRWNIEDEELKKVMLRIGLWDWSVQQALKTIRE